MCLALSAARRPGRSVCAGRRFTAKRLVTACKPSVANEGKSLPDPIRPTLRIGERPLGDAHPAYVIAEIGCNHDGRLDRARELLRAAADAGADAVKLQSFRAERLTRASEPAFPILDELAVAEDWYAPLCEEARSRGVDLLSTPFDEDHAELLARIGVPAFKIASGDLTHHDLLRRVASFGRPILMSTGLADREEIRRAVQVVREAGGSELALLHCIAAYPPCWEELNLRAVATLRDEFGVLAGLSDHTPGHEAVISAVALGARVIEKHVTFDRDLPGPDHGYALTVDEFAAMVAATRRTEAALGDGRLVAADCEKDGRRLGRRSVHAARDLEPGTNLEPSLWKIVRPADGVPSERADELAGRRLVRAVRADEPIRWGDVA